MVIKTLRIGSDDSVELLLQLIEQVAQAPGQSSEVAIAVDVLKNALAAGAATAAKQDTIIAELELKANLTETQPVSASLKFNTNDIEEASSTVTYIGMEDDAGTWYLLKIDSSSDFSFGHASIATDVGEATYSAAWTARASLSYGDYKDAF